MGVKARGFSTDVGKEYEIPMSIPIDYWWWGLITYLTLHAVHVAVWRWKGTRHHLRDLMIVFMVPVLLFLGGALAWLSFAEILAPGLTYFALTAQYIAIYPAFQASSPTIELLERVRRSGGMDRNVLIVELGGKDLVQARVRDLEIGGLVRRRGDEVELTALGSALARFFIGYRRSLGLPLGGG